MTTKSQSEKPVWWTEEHSSSWERAKAALRRDWEQTKADVSDGGHELNQDASDTVQQMAGKQGIPSGDRPNPERWEDAEPALRYGHGAGLHFVEREWDTELEEELKRSWRDNGDGGTWDRVKATVRRGWESAKFAAASTQVPLL